MSLYLTSYRHHPEIYVRGRCIYIEISSYETGETSLAPEKSMDFRTVSNFISHDSYPFIRLRHQILFANIYERLLVR